MPRSERGPLNRSPSGLGDGELSPSAPQFTAAMTPAPHRWWRSAGWGGLALSAGAGSWLREQLTAHTIPFPTALPGDHPPAAHPHGTESWWLLCHGGLLPAALLRAGEAVSELSAGTGVLPPH